MTANNDRKGESNKRDFRQSKSGREKERDTVTDDHPAENTGNRTTRKWLRLLLLLIAFICVAAGAFLLFRRPAIEKMRIIKEEKIVKKIEDGDENIIVKRDDFIIEGEEYEFFDEAKILRKPATDIFALPEDVVLTATGTIQIKSIDLKLPLWDDAGIVPLRYGAGILQGSVLPGQEGNLVVLGHRMKTRGSLFNRLGEMKIGDDVIIETTDGIPYTYIVDEIQSAVDPADLTNYIGQSDDDGIRLTLVTCTPIGVGSHRLIIIAYLAK